MDWKTYKNWKTFFSQGILNRLEESGNFMQNTGKMRTFYSKYWKNEGIWANFYFIFSLKFLFEVYLQNKVQIYLLNSLNKTLEKILKNQKNILEKPWKSQANLSVQKCWNHVLTLKSPRCHLFYQVRYIAHLHSTQYMNMVILSHDLGIDLMTFILGLDFI